MSESHETVRELRKKLGLSLRELAEKSGLSPSFLSNYENNKVNITLSSLKKIANALEVPVARLVAGEEEAKLTVVRKDQRLSLIHHKSKQGNIIQEFLTKTHDCDFEIVVLKLPAQTSSENYKTHPGEEFTYVLEGEVMLLINDSPTPLKKGDMAYYDANIPHKWENDSQEYAEILIGATPANF